ncbi:hypothetical protein E4U15_008237 [Claviceps sp. LM218 group G6]|nr:hypothetical protein E4U15_008237 [Claviceps sp. LM218 group G6]
MDVLVLSWEDDHEDRPRPSDEDYKTLYEYAISELNTTLRSKDRWATRFSAYDTLTLRGRSTWLAGQSGGRGEPYYYPARGVQILFEMLTEAGGRPPDLCREMGASGLRFAQGGRAEVEDQWRVAH